MNPAAWTMSGYGVAVIGSGLWAWFVNGGSKGLWFGLVMGLGAVGAARLLAQGKKGLGLGIASFCILVVGGWFVYEVFVRKGGDASPRLYLMIAASLVAGSLLWRQCSGAPVGESRSP